MPSFSEEIIKERLYRAEADLIFASDERMLEIIQGLQNMEPGDVRVGQAAQEMRALVKKGSSPLRRLQALQQEISGTDAFAALPQIEEVSEPTELVKKDTAAEEPLAEITAEEPLAEITAEEPLAEITAEEPLAEIAAEEPAPAPQGESAPQLQPEPGFATLCQYWTTDELAEIFGSSPATVTRWTEGKSQSLLNQKKTAVLLQAFDQLGEEQGQSWIEERKAEIAAWRKGEAPLALRFS